MIRMNYNFVPEDRRAFMENRYVGNIMSGFDDVVNETWEWLQTDEARDFYNNQRGMLNEFFHTSGINDRWNDIIDARSRKGVDIATEIYEYARRMNLEDNIIPYTPQERIALNGLCDSTYSLIRNVGEDQVRGIRQRLLLDYANGVNPRKTSLREVQLEPINGWTPEQRAVVIARTETAREINSATLQTYMADGIQFVTLLVSSNCEECLAYAENPDGSERLVPIGEALEDPCIHPNCRCAWVPSTGQMIQ